MIARFVMVPAVIVYSRTTSLSVAASKVAVRILLATFLVAWPLLASQVFAELHGGAGVPQSAQIAGSAIVVGEVTETMNAAGYTYVQVEAQGEKIWAAGPPVSVVVGETVSFSRGMGMENFTSKALNRTFDTIYFVSAIHKGDVTNSAPASATGSAATSGKRQTAPLAGPHAGLKGGASDEKVDLSGIARAEGGKTIGEIYDAAASLDGKVVIVRGKVVKTNYGVMGKNWLHLRDGSTGAGGEDDLTVTAQDKAVVGDIVVVTGKLRTDVDLGFGYHYDVILEEATITKE